MPPREIRALHIPPDRYSKLAAKGISVSEVREAVQNATRVYRGPRNRHAQEEGRCYFVESQTNSGRPLKVLVRRFDGGIARLITAWEP